MSTLITSQVVSKDETRLLLAVWDLNGLTTPIQKGKVLERIKRMKEKSSDYESSFERLKRAEAIAIVPDGKRYERISLLPEGIKLLGMGLNSSDFKFEAQIGAKTANALLGWFRQHTNLVSSSQTNGKVEKAAIASYDKFKNLALEVYNRLNRDYNYDHLVPIYRIRREIGEQVSRLEFNNWMLEMQAGDVFQLLEGSVEDSALDKIEDSVMTKLGKLRCYAKRVDT
jgi:hypothetical protein